ncbi:MAG TPA: hypothetical protein VKQ06_04300, partial [Gammaproteobacteria bacterium]|nr:hypothetical protein [Gammaproteobacteria bacterium]
MKARTRSARCTRTIRLAGAVLGICAATAAVAGPPPPSAPTTTTGDYTVTPHGCDQPSGTMHCVGLGLEERVEPSGSWRSVGTTFVDKPPGRYSYRSVDTYCDAWYGWCYSRYSSAVTVTVVDQSAPPPEPLDRQLAYRYTVHTGNVVGDSRVDLRIRRVTGPANGNGVIDEIVLEQISSGRFRAIVPSAAQSSSSLWRSSGLTVAVEDMNADGFADLLVNDVATVVPGALDPIVFASGNAYIETPKGVRAADGALRQFTQNVHDYMADNDYFYRQAPLSVNTWIYRTGYCPTQPGIDEWSMIYMLQCSDLLFVYYEVVPDYSGFSRDAVEIWQDELAVASGDLASSSAADRIVERIESVIGVGIGGWDMREIFGSGSGVDDPAERRGLDGFLA